MIHQIGAALLSRLPAEAAHRLTIEALKLGLGPVDRRRDDPILAVEAGGLSLPNCVGLAAGFDKNAEAPDAMLRAGFGLVECGTVTPRPQAGNPRPRLFRLREDRAVVNRMGFNNEGLEAFASRLERRARRGVVGANIGANKESPDRVGDYVTGLSRLWRHADYFTANVSSPNTPGLRDLQGRAALEDLLGRLAEARAGLQAHGAVRPVFLKVAPDLDEAAITDIVEVVSANRLDGIVVSNTTITRPETLRSPLGREAGGLSGAPVFALSTEILRRFRERAPRTLLLIGCGGIASGADAYAKVRAGAQVIQLYSSLVYAGPGLVGEIKRDLAARLRADGFASVAEAAGAG
jgi:dihydroorotate dehydrogenase